jgi:adenine-specific DNA-methyltransferase
MKKPIDYTIEPARGQALLHFQGRRLPDKIELFEPSLIEEVRQKGQQKMQLDTQLNPDFRNLLIHGDCLSACAYLKSQNIKVDLVYIDPPFASGANYAKKINLRTGNGKAAFENSTSEIGEEIMYADIWQKEDYLNWLYERLLAIKDVMSSNSSIYVHLDWHIGHYVKMLLDEVFGEENFRNEFIVKRIKKNVRERELVKSLNNATDMIFVYAIHDEIKYLPPTKEEEKDERWHSFEASGYRNGMDYELFGFYPASTNHWRWELEKTKRAISNYDDWLKNHSDKKTLTEFWKESGEKKDFIRKHSKTSKPEYFIPASDETLCDSLWDDIPAYSFGNDYSTEKSEELLERIINTNSSTGDFVVADFFSGSGVTAKVAHNLGKKFITCDVGINAIQTTRDRLVKTKAEFDVLKINDGVRLFRNPAQTVAKLFSLLDGYKDRAELQLGEFWDGGMINKRGTFTPVKFIGIDKKLTKELVDVIIEEVIGLEDTNQEDIKTESGVEPKIPTVKIIYAYKKPELNQEYVNKAIRQSKKTNIKAELVSLDELLAQKADVLYTPDNAVVEIKHDGTIWKVEIKKYFSSYLKNKIDDFNNKKVKAVQPVPNLFREKTIDENGDNGSEKEISKPTPSPLERAGVRLSESGLELIESVQFDTTLRNDGVWSSNLDLEDKAGVKDKIKAVYKLITNKFRIKIRNIAGDEIIIDSLDLKK